MATNIVLTIIAAICTAVIGILTRIGADSPPPPWVQQNKQYAWYALALIIVTHLVVIGVQASAESRKKAPLTLRFCGRRIREREVLTVAYGVPVSSGFMISSLRFDLGNPGKETVQDVTLLVVQPEALGQLLGSADKPTFTWTVEIGLSRGIDMVVKKVGIRYHVHMTVESVHPRITMGANLPIAITDSTLQRIDVPVTFKDGVTGILGVRVALSIPIDIMLISKDRETQHSKLNLEFYPATSLSELTKQWISVHVPVTIRDVSWAKKPWYFLRALFTFKSAFLVLPEFVKQELPQEKPKAMHPKSGKRKILDEVKPTVFLVEKETSQRYAVGYLVSLGAFFHLFKPKSMFE